MTQDRRQHRRYQSSHPAQLILGGSLTRDCQINNFSRGGFSLAMDSEALEAIRAAGKPGAERAVDVEVLLQTQTQSVEYRIPVRIVFASDSGLGAAFMHPDQRVINYLSRVSLRERRQAPESTNASVVTVLHDVQTLLQQFLLGRYDGFIAILLETFLELEERASQQAQPELRHGRSAIERDVAELRQRLFDQIGENWQQLQRSEGSETQSPREDQQLELVDQDEFDEWAAVVAASRRLEGRLSQTLFNLSQAIAHLLKSPVSNDTNPLSPYCLLWAFKKSLDPLSLSVPIRRTAYTVFAEQILTALDPLYHQIIQLLESRGYGASEPWPPQPSPSAERDTTDQAERPARPKPRSLVDKLSSYLSRDRADARAGGAAKPVSSNRAVAHALDDMVQGDRRKLADRVEQALGGHAGAEGGVALSAESRQIIDATEQLLRMAQQDPRHSSTMRRILRQVQLPLAKAAIDDPGVLDDASHPAHRLLNDLDQLALLTPSGDGSVSSQGVNERLESVLAELEMSGGKADLDQLSRQITELLSERRSLFDANLEQVLAATAQECLAVVAAREIRAFLAAELGDSISMLIDQLLRLGWAGLLVQTAAGGEKKQKHLKSYKGVLSLLNKALQPSARHAYLQPEKWQKVDQVLSKGFTDYPLYREQSSQLIRQFAECLEKGSDSYRVHNERRVEVNDSYLDQLLPATVSAPGTTDRTIEADAQSLRFIEQLKVGDWVAEQRSQGHVRMLNLVLHDSEAQRYLFVDCHGVKALDYRGEELLRRMQARQISLIEDAGLPMVERAVERALRQGFEELREQSDRDRITGLLNRRAFKRELDRLLDNSRQTQNRHSLVCLDVDKFTLVNELCGTEGGDRFLENLAAICRSFLHQSNALFRTGDNEFSILLAQCPLDEGYRTAESLRKAIEHYHFQWSGRQVTVTVSVGLAEINAESGQADELSHAAQSACEEAKSQGRNRCCCYQDSGEIFEQKKRLVQSVPLIEQALEKDQLELFAQLIQPVFMGDGLSDHYEVLLRRMDEENHPASPDPFIQAAEHFERMQAVDRWVVQHFFSWANTELTAERVAELGGFSINLSGQSMGDASFIPFLKEQIQHSVIAPEHLSFEITETAMVNQMGQVNVLMKEIRALGCRFFLDDFGTGYASYSYLKEFPVDVVKIDGIFVKDIADDEVSYAMVKSITEVAHQMGKLVVAEFVHCEAVLNALRKLEVDYAQGFCIGRPGPLKNLARYSTGI
ncbi:DUF1631 family protein [Sedimenticola sp.]|uniref:DUF1631 family protein n=1 Tax=Sedimenticola sp. TaxID=1940285 RepID=UPI003D09C240